MSCCCLLFTKKSKEFNLLTKRLDTLERQVVELKQQRDEEKKIKEPINEKKEQTKIIKEDEDSDGGFQVIDSTTSNAHCILDSCSS